MNPDILSAFESLLSRPDVVEGAIQAHMEAWTELIPLPHLLGHDLQWNAVISQFEVDKSRHPDFAYLTKNTARWRLVLMELERPQKTLFRGSGRVDFSADVNAAIAQIRDWQTYVEAHPGELRERLRPLLHFSPDFADNLLEFRYVLVVGRWPMKRYTATQAARVTQLAEREGIELLTYDSILRGSRELRIGQPKNVLSHSATRIASSAPARPQVFSRATATTRSTCRLMRSRGSRPGVMTWMPGSQASCSP